MTYCSVCNRDWVYLEYYGINSLQYIFVLYYIITLYTIDESLLVP